MPDMLTVVGEQAGGRSAVDIGHGPSLPGADDREVKPVARPEQHDPR